MFFFRSANRISGQLFQVGSSHVILLSFSISTCVLINMAAVLTLCFLFGLFSEVVMKRMMTWI